LEEEASFVLCPSPPQNPARFCPGGREQKKKKTSRPNKEAFLVGWKSDPSLDSEGLECATMGHWTFPVVWCAR
jgi:hypothetical protein